MVLGLATPRAMGSPSYEYIFTGAEPGYSGELYLDSNSSSNGSLSDIVSLTVTDPRGTFTYNPNLPNLSQFSYFQTQSYNALESSFTWNPSEITEMNILFDYYFIAGYTAGSYAEIGQNAPVEGGTFTGISTLNDYVQYESDLGGDWVSAHPPPVPDRASTLALLGAALAALGITAAARQRGQFRGAEL